MATAKSPTGANSSANTNQPSRIREDVPALKNKMIELERQVNEYKTKLDELRRAKATTVVKLEKEYVNAAAPGLNNRSERSKPCDKCEEFERMIENERKSTTQLKKLLEEKETRKQQSSPNAGPCSKCPELKQLLDIEKENHLQFTEQLHNQKKLTQEEKNSKELFLRTLEITQADLIQANKTVEKLRQENQEYKNSFETMKREHSDKMADLCRREEEAKKQVAAWEQMYREWMATMERRVNNLQMTNEDLQTFVHTDSDEHHSAPRGNQRR